ncbi:polyphosphate polymerase domain-containing protein [Microbacterium proteolyticum]|uniref:polyphosphate polymerase domain-containing protein n=1 Tax=Microbacterium proteolyticum TaxID=1572644 RepID=UPI002415A567|nr:polyphosphate polymerase domain-containing protein [Microbacterium proteolyticum]
MSARERVGAALDVLPPVSLEELTEDAALLTRVDRKYLVPLAAAGELLEELGRRADAPRVLEIDARREMAYRSVYFDTPDLLSFRLAAHGRRRRFKLRTRSYLDTGSTFLEMKTRGARGATQKDRDAYPAAVPDRLTAAARDEVALALDAIGIPATRADDLDSRLQTRYRRATLLLPGDGGAPSSRATVDLDLEWIDAIGGGFTLPRFAIVETKSPGRAGRLDRALWRAGHRPARISKYATGLAALHQDLPRNRWARVLAGPLASAVPTPDPDRKDAPCAAA